MSAEGVATTEGGGSYPDLASPTDSVIAGDFGAMTAAEQEQQREEWKAELAKTEEEIATLKQVDWSIITFHIDSILKFRWFNAPGSGL